MEHILQIVAVLESECHIRTKMQIQQFAGESKIIVMESSDRGSARTTTEGLTRRGMPEESMGGMGKADDETVVGGKWSWSTFAHPSFVIQRYKDVVQTETRALGRLILNSNLQLILHELCARGRL